MRKFYMILVLIINVVVLNAQTLEFYDKNDVLLNYGDTVKVDSLASVSEMVGVVKVKNITAATQSILCEKQIMSVVSGTTNTFCWGLCFPPTTMISPDPQFIGAGEVSTGFSGHYYPSNNSGTSLIRYVFRVYHGDTAWIYIKFNATYSGVAENKLSVSVSAPYPNPANDETHINYNIPTGVKAILQVYNICGKIEKQFALSNNNGSININVSDLPSGIYLCSLNVNGRIVRTNRLIVNH